MSRRSVAGVVVGALVFAGGGYWWYVGREGSTTAVTPPTTNVTTVAVRRVDLTSTELVNGTLGWSPLPPIVNRGNGTWTMLPEAGATITPGQVLAAVDGRPEVLFTGATPAWRPIGPGSSNGPDIQQLENQLSEFGFDPEHRLTIDDHFSAATAAAMRRFQHAMGETETGRVQDGDIVFASGPVRVGAVHAVLGGAAHADDIPFEVTGTARTVTVQLDPGRQRGIAVGESVIVDLLDGSTVAGHIESLSRVATLNVSAASGNAPPTATVAMTISLDDQTAGGGLDQVPVQVHLVTASRTAVLAVPVTALLALSEGGYGLEVIGADGADRIVAITTGLFSDSMVEVSGGGIEAGTKVVTGR